MSLALVWCLAAGLILPTIHPPHPHGAPPPQRHLPPLARAAGGKGIENIALVELGSGCWHGDNSTKAAVRACNNAVEWASVKVRNIIPGAYESMKLHVHLGVPNPDQVDLKQIASCFPYGRLQPILLEKGGLLGSSRGGVASEETVDGLMTVACACVTIGWDDALVPHAPQSSSGLEELVDDGPTGADPTESGGRWFEQVSRTTPINSRSIESLGPMAAARLEALSKRGDGISATLAKQQLGVGELLEVGEGELAAQVAAQAAKTAAAAAKRRAAKPTPSEPAGPLGKKPSANELMEGTREMNARALAAKERWSVLEEGQKRSRVLTPYEAFAFIGEEEEVEIIDVRTPAQRQVPFRNPLFPYLTPHSSYTSPTLCRSLSARCAFLTDPFFPYVTLPFFPISHQIYHRHLLARRMLLMGSARSLSRGHSRCRWTIW